MAKKKTTAPDSGEPSKIRDLAAESLNVVYDDDLVITGGGDTASVGFTIRDYSGDPITAEMADLIPLQYGVYTDKYKSDYAVAPSSPTGTIAEPTVGNFLQDEGSEATIVLADTSTNPGRFECTLTKTSGTFPEEFYVGCKQASSPNIDCSGFQKVRFEN